VRGVGFCVLAIAVHPLLSSYITDAACCGMLRSFKTDLRNKIILPASYPLMFSAFIDDEPATVGCSFVLYAMTPPANSTLMPVVDLLVLRHAA
jgi:hypothetical protein